MIVFILTLTMILTLTSCGVRQSLDQKITEQVSEGVINKATGGEANINIDGGQLTVNGTDSHKITVGDNSWPEGNAADLIPKFNNGDIVSSINSNKTCMIMLEQVEAKDYEHYVKELKEQGFTNDVAEFKGEMGHSYNAHLNDNTIIWVLYNPEEKALTINLEIDEQQE